MTDPERLDVRGAVTCGRDVVLDVNVLLEGAVQLGDGVRVGANCVLSKVQVGAGTLIKPNCVIERAEIGARCRIGPFSRIRPESTLRDGVHVGNFVEVKKSELGAGSKANHLSYLGDAVIGAGVNVGAGTITCNYDGANKWRTEIGDARLHRLGRHARGAGQDRRRRHHRRRLDDHARCAGGQAQPRARHAAHRRALAPAAKK